MKGWSRKSRIPCQWSLMKYKHKDLEPRLQRSRWCRNVILWRSWYERISCSVSLISLLVSLSLYLCLSPPLPQWELYPDQKDPYLPDNLSSRQIILLLALIFCRLLPNSYSHNYSNIISLFLSVSPVKSFLQILYKYFLLLQITPVYSFRSPYI